MGIPGADAALKEASFHGYEAVVLVIVLLAMLTFFGMLGKWFLKSTDRRLEEAAQREQRLAQRITTLEAFVENTLTGMVRDCTALMQKNIESLSALTTALNGRLCLLDPMRQDCMVDRIADSVGEKLVDQFRKQ